MIILLINDRFVHNITSLLSSDPLTELEGLERVKKDVSNGFW